MQTPQLKKNKKTLSWFFQFRQSNPKGVPNFSAVQNDLRCPKRVSTDGDIYPDSLLVGPNFLFLLLNR
jgi:hypothetical protein